jgi:hypothetical protein
MVVVGFRIESVAADRKPDRWLWGLDHRAGHLCPLRMTVKPFPIYFFPSLPDCRKIPTSFARLFQIAGDTRSILCFGERVVIRRGEPHGSTHGGGDAMAAA